MLFYVLLLFLRYLVFFDDGCAQYVKHEDTYVVCTQSKNFILGLFYCWVMIYQFFIFLITIMSYKVLLIVKLISMKRIFHTYSAIYPVITQQMNDGCSSGFFSQLTAIVWNHNKRILHLVRKGTIWNCQIIRVPLPEFLLLHNTLIYVVYFQCQSYHIICHTLFLWKSSTFQHFSALKTFIEIRPLPYTNLKITHKYHIKSIKFYII